MVSCDIPLPLVALVAIFGGLHSGWKPNAQLGAFLEVQCRSSRDQDQGQKRARYTNLQGRLTAAAKPFHQQCLGN